MKLGAALQELKILQSKLARLYNLRSETFNVLENKKTEVDFDEVTNEIEDLVDNIRSLKVKIAKTNILTQIEFDGKKITIQEMIFLIADLRSSLARLEYLKPRGPVYLGGQAVEYIPQKRQDEIANIISDFEKKKSDMDKLLQAKNWSTELIE